MKINKRREINKIVTIINILSIVACAITFFKYIINNPQRVASESTYLEVFIVGIVLIFYVIFIYFINGLKKDDHVHKYLFWIESIMLMVIITLTVALSGFEISRYKFLFLFVIITATLQGGIRMGMTIACIVSTIIIGLYFKCSVPGYRDFANNIVIIGALFLMAWAIGYYTNVNDGYIEEIKNLANKDGLTGLFNHRYFYDKLRSCISISKRKNQPVSLMFIDIDHFKQYNDVFGHLQGDKVLRGVSDILLEIGEKGIVSRYGGEEFAIILPNTKEHEAVLLGEWLRKKIENAEFYGQENQPNGNLTVSIGISTFPNRANDDMELIRNADDALYRAKFFHKNRVETYVSILDELKNYTNESDQELIKSIKTLISVINAKDKYTYSHIERVVIYCRLIAEKMNLTDSDKKKLIYGAYMHDIGKINIPKEILRKKVPLTNNEWLQLKDHPEKGVDIIKEVEALQDVIPLILYHHERYDGKGYPANLVGEDIPFLARVLTVVDSFDAMTSNRPYNKRKSYEEGIAELKKCSGAQFDPYIVECFSEIISEKIDNIEEYSKALK